jgi:hypothetical protein
MKRLVRIVAPAIAAIALVAALGASAFAASPKVNLPSPGHYAIPEPVPAAQA